MIANLIIFYGIIIIPLVLGSVFMFKSRYFTVGTILLVIAYVFGVFPFTQDNSILNSIVAVIAFWGFVVSISLDGI